MPYGPVELLVLEFPGNQFTGELAPALTELSDLTDNAFAAFDPVIAELSGFLTHEDAVYLSASLAPNSSAGIMLFENAWAKRFTDAVVNANGHVVVNERIPRTVIADLVAAQADSAA